MSTDLLTELASLREMTALLEQRIAQEQADRPWETLDMWSERWLRWRARVYQDAERARTAYAKWIAPRLGALPVVLIDRPRLVGWVDWIQVQVDAGELRSTTAWRVWTVLAAMMRDAAQCREPSLRVREDNPVRQCRGPERGDVRAGTWLYPSEFLRLMECKRIPLRFRRHYAISIYLYPRAGELEALRWRDIDLTTGRLHIHQAVQTTGKVGKTKTGEDRQLAMEPALLPLLRSMKRFARGPLVSPCRVTALTFRRHLRAAGLTRDDLYANDGRRRPITVHDLRATGITWQALRGDSPLHISERVGHRHVATTERYMRRGRLMALSAGEVPFPELPECVL